MKFWVLHEVEGTVCVLAQLFLFCGSPRAETRHSGSRGAPFSQLVEENGAGGRAQRNERRTVRPREHSDLSEYRTCELRANADA